MWYTFWPQLEQKLLMPAEIIGLGISLRAGEVVLDYRILRPSLVQRNRVWKARSKWTEQELGKLAVSVRDEETWGNDFLSRAVRKKSVKM
ncbi:hypothetical protein D6D01_06815 [Aureobasidium pullulans]|uniref:Uncharacterized protein n=1 Tax=Aureobasidium pullulans TaxID=5580 RepID=A0A4S9KV27_AURPU|nr:hypothetical protein D6D01_06815 [Aureobasidium pullulans]